MIYAKATVKGEPDTAPFTLIFQYVDKTDEQILYNSVEVVREKLARNMKINTTEALLVYRYYVISEILAGKSASDIEKNASKILSEDMVMIGVPESLGEITFEVMIDNIPKQHVKFEKPIQASSSYVLAAK